MKWRILACAFLAIGIFIPGISANAQLNYGFRVESGSRIEGNFNWLQYGSRAGAGQESGWGSAPSADYVDLGFVFNFNGRDYTNVVISSNGILVMGDGLNESWTNDLTNVSGNVIAPFWDAMRVRSGGNGCEPSIVQYAVVGDEPERIFVADYYLMGLSQGQNGINAIASFQVRLYEGSNKIEFYYDHFDPSDQTCNQWGNGGNGSVTTSASIGLAIPGAFISVTPDGGNATSSLNDANNDINLIATGLEDGVLYTFCPAGLEGNVSEGGTDLMATGDTLFLGRQVILSSSQEFYPFTLRSLCASNFTYTISGPRAGEYSITPNNGDLPEEGNTPTIRFAPTGIGIRYATLRVVDGENFVNRTFILAGEGVPRTTWIGDVAQGGTDGLTDGDTLMRNIAVYNGAVENFTPITIDVLPGGNTPAPVTYTLTDPSGQFRIDRSFENVMPGGSSTPVITFAPTLIGWQTARLTVNAEGEVRSYLIRAFARGSGALFFVGGEPLGSGASLFRNVYSCVGGTDVQTVEIQVESIGDEPFLIETEDVYQTENIIKQGTPPFELLRDPFGEYVQMKDYYISSAPGSPVPLELPLSIEPGTTRTLYLNFLPARAGKRQARAFFRTNGLNFYGINVEKNSVQGMLNFELVGQGLGASLTDVTGKKLPAAVVFPSTEVRSTSTVMGYIRNNGECDMLIPSEDFRLVSGDVSEFKIVSGLRSSKDGLGNYVIPAGQIDSFAISFTPTRSGSRRASIRIKTNDSTLVTRGITELGAYYLDVFGNGKVGLESRRASLPPAVIDGPGSRGPVVLENTSGDIVQVTDIRIIGANGEVIEDPTNMWPARPFVINPGTRVNLGVAFNPATGSAPGARAVRMEVTLSNGQVLTVDIEAIAGTRQLAVAPTSLFQGLNVGVGDVRRQFVSVTNTGTFPVVVQQLRLNETNPGDYSVSDLARNVIEPGQVEFYQVTYSPQATGVSSGTLEIISNSTNGPHIVTLGGQASTTAPAGGASGSTIAVTGEDAVAIRPGVGYSGWGASMENGTLLWQSAPNPAGSQADIRYYLPQEGKVELTLYTSNGKLVRELAAGMEEVGEHHITVDVRDLSSGRYYYTLRTSGGAVTLALDVVK